MIILVIDDPPPSALPPPPPPPPEMPVQRPWCGTFEALGDGTDVPFMTVPVPNKSDGENVWNTYNPHLIRYYIERVWQLKRPDVIITVTGRSRTCVAIPHGRDEMIAVYGAVHGARLAAQAALSCLELPPCYYP